MLLPWGPVGAAVGERLMLGVSAFALLALLVAITAGRRWAWWLFGAYYLLNLTVSLRLTGTLLVLTGPFGLPYALQVACQGAALLLRLLAEALGLLRVRRAGR